MQRKILRHADMHSSYKVKVAQWVIFQQILHVWYYQNDKQLFLDRNNAFISRAVLILSKGSANYE